MVPDATTNCQHDVGVPQKASNMGPARLGLSIRTYRSPGRANMRKHVVQTQVHEQNSSSSPKDILPHLGGLRRISQLLPNIDLGTSTAQNQTHRLGPAT